jgi:hypothetical protein
MRKSIDEQLLERERADRIRREADAVARLSSKIRLIINELGEFHPSSEHLRQAIARLSPKRDA